jgi:hypothetical protein
MFRKSEFVGIFATFLIAVFVAMRRKYLTKHLKLSTKHSRNEFSKWFFDLCQSRGAASLPEAVAEFNRYRRAKIGYPAALSVAKRSPFLPAAKGVYTIYPDFADDGPGLSSNSYPVVRATRPEAELIVRYLMRPRYQAPILPDIKDHMEAQGHQMGPALGLLVRGGVIEKSYRPGTYWKRFRLTDEGWRQALLY